MKRALIISVLLTPLMLQMCVSEPANSQTGGGTSWYKVEDVVNGDTIVVKGVGRVKYIGVRAPKRSISGKTDERLWKQSLEKNRELVGDKWVRFEMDERRQDDSGRFLAYIFVQVDYRTELFVNGEMVRLGFAKVGEFGENRKYVRRLENLEDRARSRGIGVWTR